jgi:hypothetical protein
VVVVNGGSKLRSFMSELKLDLGCGNNKKEGFIGVDSIKFDAVDIVADLTQKWPWEDNTVSEVHASHFVEHLTQSERCHFANELHRVLIPGGKATIIVPHWASCRAYGDPTHKWPAISEFWFYYLSKEWRMGNKEKGLGANAPHTDKQYYDQGFDCDFEAVWGYSMNPLLISRNQEYQTFAMSWYKEACQDLIATLTKKHNLPEIPKPNLI